MTTCPPPLLVLSCEAPPPIDPVEIFIWGFAAGVLALAAILSAYVAGSTIINRKKDRS